MNITSTNLNIARFSNSVGKVSRELNKIAIHELKSDKIKYTYPKASTEDLKILTSKKLEDSYKRVSWKNPKDNKVYHILEETRTKDKINVRILSSDGEFIKNAELKPQKIVIFDQFKTLGGLRNLLKLKFNKTVSHGEIVETFLRRTNPFANVERLEHKKNLFELIKYRGVQPQSLMNKRFNQLASSNNKVDYISISDASSGDIGEYAKLNGLEQKKIMKEYGLSAKEYKPLLSSFKELIKNKARIFVTASNEPKSAKTTINKFLAIDGVEGVGSLGENGKIAPDSASRNSIFTQHYEARNFVGKIVEDNGKILGINITGQPGVDLPYNKKNKSLIRNIGGTSYSTPIRVGKVSLNDMMEGVL